LLSRPGHRHVACWTFVGAGVVPLDQEPATIRTIAAVLAAFALVSFRARVEDKPAEAKAVAAIGRAEERAGALAEVS